MLTIQEAKKRILRVLNEVCVIEEVDLAGDCDLNDYIADSIQFITFIVGLEEEFQIEFPEELLLFETISSLNNFCQTIVDIYNDKDFK